MRGKNADLVINYRADPDNGMGNYCYCQGDSELAVYLVFMVDFRNTSK